MKINLNLNSSPSVPYLDDLWFISKLKEVIESSYNVSRTKKFSNIESPTEEGLDKFFQDSGIQIHYSRVNADSDSFQEDYDDDFYDTVVESPEDLPENLSERYYICRLEKPGYHSALAVTVCHSYMSITVWAVTAEVCEKVEGLFSSFVKEKDAQKPHPKFVFWSRALDGQASNQISKLECPSFEEIKDNYNPKVVHEIERLMKLNQPHEHGKLILLHGSPGLGKTYLIRALAKHWFEKFRSNPELIVDPENFFDQATYLNQVSVRSWHNKPRLILIEDAANIFSTGCRLSPGFTRLLNMSDGLLGQGKKIVFLLTANETLDQIDDAILRPGRCLLNLYIPPLSSEHAESWLAKRNASDKFSEIKNLNEVSLAQLYALLRGDPLENDDRKAKGFGF